MTSPSLHVCLISVHGLIRGRAPELGRDADTGGQVLYVIELARALAAHPEVRRVDLVTRLIDDPAVDTDYARPEERLCDGARILRIAAGGAAYIHKEALWDHLDAFADALLERYRAERATPDIVHSHYADAGYVGARVAPVLGRPLVHTGHSLGRVKRRRLLASGMRAEEIERRYAMARRVEAEEHTLASASRVITSTHQEIERQYELYDFYRPQAMRVIPPGTDLERFRPPDGDERESDVARELARFLEHPARPMILALSRADARKNVAALVRAYGQDRALRERANLVIVMGVRHDMRELDDGARAVLTELLQLIDRHDLYGRVAYPKRLGADEVPVLYRLAALSGGVFVNPALTEPFGLTLIEAAASGLPIVATEDGGPRDILRNCDNGLLIDPLEPGAIASAVRAVIDDWEGWQRRSASGLAGVRAHYAWSAHAAEYIAMVKPLVAEREAASAPPRRERPVVYADRALFTDLNGALLGGETAARERLRKRIRPNRKRFLFGVITGLRLDAALRLMRRHRIPEPDILITSTGTSISYAPKLVEDRTWSRWIERQWTPKVVRRVLAEVPGLALRERAQQSEFKISYLHDPALAPSRDEIAAMLFKEEQAVNVILSHGRFLNVLPIRASKGLAMRYAAARLQIPLERVLAIGGSAADADMLRGNALAAVVGGAGGELGALAGNPRVRFTDALGAGGILEAIEYYDFLGRCAPPSSAVDAEAGAGGEAVAAPPTREEAIGATGEETA